VQVNKNDKEAIKNSVQATIGPFAE